MLSTFFVAGQSSSSHGREVDLLIGTAKSALRDARQFAFPNPRVESLPARLERSFAVAAHNVPPKKKQTKKH